MRRSAPIFTRLRGGCIGEELKPARKKRWRHVRRQSVHRQIAVILKWGFVSDVRMLGVQPVLFRTWPLWFAIGLCDPIGLCLYLLVGSIMGSGIRALNKNIATRPTRRGK